MATRTCSGGNCDGTCTSGFLDCDGNKRTNGCEININTNSQHCGGCNAPCATGEVCVNGVCSTCNATVLLLCDGLCTTASNTQAKAALDAAGFPTTTVSNGVYSYAGSPAASGFGAVVMPVGGSYSTDMPPAGQTSIVNAQAAGTGVVFTEWASYQPYSGRWATLRSLVLMTYVPSSTSSSAVTYNLTSVGHPIWDGVSTPFVTTVPSVYHQHSGGLVNGGVAIATWTYSTITMPAVIVRDTTGGRLVHITHAAGGGSAAWYGDANLLKIFVNSAKWATRCL